MEIKSSDMLKSLEIVVYIILVFVLLTFTTIILSSMHTAYGTRFFSSLIGRYFENSFKEVLIRSEKYVVKQIL